LAWSVLFAVLRRLGLYPFYTNAINPKTISSKQEILMTKYDYDILVIGAGQGGLPAAHMAANLGAKVALIEQAEVGGT